MMGWRANLAFIGLAAAGVAMCNAPDQNRTQASRVAAIPPTPSAAEIEAERKAREETARIMESARARYKGQDHQTFCPALGKAIRSKNLPPERPGMLLYAAERFGVSGDDWEPIKTRSLRIGMSECSLIAAIGLPETANRHVYATGTRIQWVYRSRHLYVYSTDGVVTSWQD